jgi:hypothetical protein
VIPFLGAGASLCERPPACDWRSDGFLPSGSELASFLAQEYAFPEPGPLDLARVSQYVELAVGDATLFEELHSIFASSYKPNKVHHLLADLPAILRAEHRPSAGQLTITTNYDDALEAAFAAAGEEFDLVTYFNEPNEPGKFVHQRPDGGQVENPKHTDYRDFALEQRCIVLKIHGAVNRTDESSDSYVITEDDYIDYLAREMSKQIPAYLMARMKTSHFLFLGYSMRDWNLRVLLRQIWSEEKRRFGSWAIQRNPSEIDQRFWERNGVEIIESPLEEWVDGMREQLT